MCERLFALLLRLYPREFRRAHGADALQLIRDRSGDERGVLLQLRLCLDLIADLLAVTLQRMSPAEPLLVATNASAVRAPSLVIHEPRGPRPQSLAAGLLTSAILFAAFSQMFYPRAMDDMPLRLLVPSLFETTPDQSSGTATPSPEMTSADSHKLIETVAANLKQHYFDPAVGQQLAEALLDHERKGDYDALPLGPELAARLTSHIHDTSRALGIPPGTFVADVIYSARPIPVGPPVKPSAETLERNRSALLHQNCLFEKIETLRNNIGYLKLNGFPDASVCRSITMAAMAAVNNADALIIDLRDNPGGFGTTALQIGGYLFDRPTDWFDPRGHTADTARTASPVPGNKLADKAVYILTSVRTASAAEYFTYNLKMLKRATLVGDTTGGRQHSGGFYRIDDHFGMGIQHTAPPTNPFPVKGWEVIGVTPDVAVPSTEAFDMARMLAESQVRR
jgi:hypothetical protein